MICQYEKNQHHLVSLFIAILSLFTFTSCKSQPPVIQDMSVSVSPLLPGEATEITVLATDPNKKSFTYHWKAQKGRIVNDVTRANVRYIAPDEAGIDTVTVTIDNGTKGGVVTNSISVPIVEPAVIRLHDFALPVGWMIGKGAADSFIKVTEEPSEHCHSDRPCQKITYSPGGVWGGMYWWPRPCGEYGTAAAWKQVTEGTCGINLLEYGQVREIKRLTFWVRTERGNEIIEFKTGGEDIAPIPGRSLGKMVFPPTWKQFSIDVQGLDLTNATGIFAWVITDADNRQGVTFYLDDIQFEGVKK